MTLFAVSGSELFLFFVFFAALLLYRLQQGARAVAGNETARGIAKDLAKAAAEKAKRKWL